MNMYDPNQMMPPQQDPMGGGIAQAGPPQGPPPQGPPPQGPPVGAPPTQNLMEMWDELITSWSPDELAAAQADPNLSKNRLIPPVLIDAAANQMLASKERYEKANQEYMAAQTPPTTVHQDIGSGMGNLDGAPEGLPPGELDSILGAPPVEGLGTPFPEGGGVVDAMPPEMIPPGSQDGPMVDPRMLEMLPDAGPPQPGKVYNFSNGAYPVRGFSNGSGIEALSPDVIAGLSPEEIEQLRRLLSKKNILPVSESTYSATRTPSHTITGSMVDAYGENRARGDLKNALRGRDPGMVRRKLGPGRFESSWSPGVPPMSREGVLADPVLGKYDIELINEYFPQGVSVQDASFEPAPDYTPVPVGPDTTSIAPDTTPVPIDMFRRPPRAEDGAAENGALPPAAKDDSPPAAKGDPLRASINQQSLDAMEGLSRDFRRNRLGDPVEESILRPSPSWKDDPLGVGAPDLVGELDSIAPDIAMPAQESAFGRTNRSLDAIRKRLEDFEKPRSGQWKAEALLMMAAEMLNPENATGSAFGDIASGLGAGMKGAVPIMQRAEDQDTARNLQALEINAQLANIESRDAQTEATLASREREGKAGRDVQREIAENDKYVELYKERQDIIYKNNALLQRMEEGKNLSEFQKKQIDQEISRNNMLREDIESKIQRRADQSTFERVSGVQEYEYSQSNLPLMKKFQDGDISESEYSAGLLKAFQELDPALQLQYAMMARAGMSPERSSIR